MIKVMVDAEAYMDAVNGRRQRGFTLVELLVVIGIIALLISILLPALGRARDQAARVRCLANMKQLHLAYIEYAMKNRDAIPIGYVQGFRQMNYMIWNNAANGGQPQLYGAIWNAGIVKSPGLFYCQIRTDDSNSYKTDRNPWPPPEFGQPANAIPTRSSYSCRPEVNWERKGFPSDGTNNLAWPKLSKLKNKALFADCVSDWDDLLASHKNGTNVIYSNGGGVWVPKDVFINNLKSANPDFQVNKQTNDEAIWRVDSTTGKFTGVWADLDAQQSVKISSGSPTPPPR